MTALCAEVGGRGRGRPPTNKLAGAKRSNTTTKGNTPTGNGTKKANAGGVASPTQLKQGDNKTSNMANWLKPKNPKNGEVDPKDPKDPMEIDEHVMNDASNEEKEEMMEGN